MATPVGTTYGLFKKALMDLLHGVSGLADVAVNYDSPKDADDVVGNTGLYEAVFFGDTDPEHLRETGISGEQDNVVICSVPLTIDEEYEVPLMVQVMLPLEGTQEEADLRVDQIMYHIMKTVASNPHMGIMGPSHPEITVFYVTKAKFHRKSGLVEAGRGSGCTLKFQIKARIQYGLV